MGCAHWKCSSLHCQRNAPIYYGWKASILRNVTNFWPTIRIALQKICVTNGNSQAVQRSERCHIKGNKRHQILLCHYRYVVQFQHGPLHEPDHTLHNLWLDPPLQMLRDQIWKWHCCHPGRKLSGSFSSLSFIVNNLWVNISSSKICYRPRPNCHQLTNQQQFIRIFEEKPHKNSSCAV